MITDRCQQCQGDGYIFDHHPECDGECQDCPVQVACEACEGNGYVAKPMNGYHE